MYKTQRCLGASQGQRDPSPASPLLSSTMGPSPLLPRPLLRLKDLCLPLHAGDSCIGTRVYSHISTGHGLTSCLPRAPVSPCHSQGHPPQPLPGQLTHPESATSGLRMPREMTHLSLASRSHVFPHRGPQAHSSIPETLSVQQEMGKGLRGRWTWMMHTQMDTWTWAHGP